MSEPETNVVPAFSPFWPVCLLAVSMVIFLGWQTELTVRQNLQLIRVREQQAVRAREAAAAETQLQSIMLDLIDLAKTDEDARTIVTKYNIKFNAPPEGAAATSGATGMGTGTSTPSLAPVVKPVVPPKKEAAPAPANK